MPYHVAALAEPLACVVNGMQSAGIGESGPVPDNALVFGAGPIGLLLALSLKSRGIATVTIADINESRLAFAEELGLQAAVSGSEALLWFCDGLVQLLASTTAEVFPTGAVTALIGGPLLLWLLPKIRPTDVHRAEGVDPATRRRLATLLPVLVIMAGLVFAALAIGKGPEGWTGYVGYWRKLPDQPTLAAYLKTRTGVERGDYTDPKPSPRTSNPSYLQPLHQFRPTKPSQGFSGTGLGRFRPKPKTPGRFQTYLLFTMYSEQASVLANDANFYFSRRISIPMINPPIQNDSPSRLVARAVRSVAIKDRVSVRTELRQSL